MSTRARTLVNFASNVFDCTDTKPLPLSTSSDTKLPTRRTHSVTVVALHNFGASKTTARLPLADLAGSELHDVLDGTRKAVRIPEGATFDVSLPPYGFRWLRSTPTTA